MSIEESFRHQQTNNQTASPDSDPFLRDPLAREKIEKTKKSFFGFFVMRTRLTLLIIISIVLLGGLALWTIPREAEPEVKIPIAVVTTLFPGASPLDIENLVTENIETKVEELDDVKLVTSQSVLGLSSVTVEFEAEANLKDSIRNLKDKVLEVRGLPDDAEDPIVTEIRVDSTPIITVSLAGPLAESEFKVLGESIQDELEKIPGVSEVLLLGVQEKEFAVTIKHGELERLGINLGMVISAIASSNVDTPLGSITIDKTNYNLRTIGKIASGNDLANVVVTTVNGQVILLKDIATINDQFADRNNLARLSVDGGTPVDTISLQILKKTGGNILNIVDTAKKRLAILSQNGAIPPEVEIEFSNDYSQFIREDLRILGTSGLQAVALIFIILLIALSLREAVISVLAIPLTFLITFVVINFRGDTLNSLVLFSLVLSLGLLVDAFIIILEGIFTNMRLGYASRDAALLAIAHFRNPLISGALTTIAAFIPMLLVSGIVGEFLQVLPITISTVLFASLFVSIAIVPTIAAVILKNKKVGDTRVDSVLERLVTNKLTNWYIPWMNKFLKNRRKKMMLLGVSVGLFATAIGLLVSPVIAVELFPRVDIDFSFIDIEMPVGTSLKTTDELVRQVEAYLLTQPNIQSFTTSVGQSSSFGFSEQSSSAEHLASINVTFVDDSKRETKSFEINDQMRRDLASIQTGKITVRDISSGPPTGAPIEVRITGEDLAVLDRIGERLIDIMKQANGVIDVESDKAVSPADLTFRLKHEALAQSGLTVAEVSSFLRTALFGVTATEISADGDDVDVVVRFDEQKVNSVEQIQNLSIVGASGQAVKLSRMADFSLEPALATIRHRGFTRTLSVRANVEKGFTSSELVPQIERAIHNESTPDGYEIDFGGEVEDIEQSFSELWNAMIVAVLLILSILVLQFNSFKKPFIILLSLPLAVIGVVVGMLIFGLSFSFSVFLGIVSLAGIVVNDAIVLLDKADRNVSELGLKPRAAIINAGATRLQPIILTSITTIGGVLPLAFADEFWFGLSIAIMFGIGFATMLQLFVLPMIYLKLEGKAVLKQMAPPKTDR